MPSITLKMDENARMFYYRMELRAPWLELNPGKWLASAPETECLVLGSTSICLLGAMRVFTRGASKGRKGCTMIIWDAP